jgi:prolyl-tRNA editing enzyme YbaK/EbsC (Cys-tRNA(Pro) deacylase)
MAMTVVTRYLREHGIRFETLRHAPVETALGAAYALGLPAEQLVKTIVVDVGPEHVLALIPATGRLDLGLLREGLGAHDVHLATEEELEHDFPRFELGTLPSLGSLLSARVLIDPEVVKQPTVVFAAGSRQESVRVSTRDLLRLERATVVPLVREAGSQPLHRADEPDEGRIQALRGKRADVGLTAAEALELGYLQAREERDTRMREQSAEPMGRRFQANRFLERRTRDRERAIRTR